MLGLTNIKALYKVWLDIAAQENLIIIVPNGTLGSSNSRGWNDCRNDAPTNPTSNDVEFIIGLLDFVQAKYKSNASKVFAVGTSNGGHFAIRLAHEIPNKMTAFASIVAPNSVNSKCTNSNIKVSALFMNGTDDPLCHIMADRCLPIVARFFQRRTLYLTGYKENTINTTPEISTLTDVNSTVTKYDLKNKVEVLIRLCFLS